MYHLPSFGDHQPSIINHSGRLGASSSLGAHCRSGSAGGEPSTAGSDSLHDLCVPPPHRLSLSNLRTDPRLCYHGSRAMGGRFARVSLGGGALCRHGVDLRHKCGGAVVRCAPDSRPLAPVARACLGGLALLFRFTDPVQLAIQAGAGTEVNLKRKELKSVPGSLFLVLGRITSTDSF